MGLDNFQRSMMSIVALKSDVGLVTLRPKKAVFLLMFLMEVLTSFGFAGGLADIGKNLETSARVGASILLLFVFLLLIKTADALLYSSKLVLSETGIVRVEFGTKQEVLFSHVVKIVHRYKQEHTIRDSFFWGQNNELMLYIDYGFWGKPEAVKRFLDFLEDNVEVTIEFRAWREGVK